MTAVALELRAPDLPFRGEEGSVTRWQDLRHKQGAKEFKGPDPKPVKGSKKKPAKGKK